MKQRDDIYWWSDIFRWHDKWGRCEHIENGHHVYSYNEGLRWYFIDNNELASYQLVESDKVIINTRPCPLCSKIPTKEGYDACLGYICGAKSACCGHGVTSGYVSYDTAERVRLPKLRGLPRYKSH